MLTLATDYSNLIPDALRFVFGGLLIQIALKLVAYTVWCGCFGVIWHDVQTRMLKQRAVWPEEPTVVARSLFRLIRGTLGFFLVGPFWVYLTSNAEDIMGPWHRMGMISALWGTLYFLRAILWVVPAIFTLRMKVGLACVFGLLGLVFDGLADAAYLTLRNRDHLSSSICLAAYTGILVLIVLWTRAIRRRWQLRALLCVRCKYNLTGNTTGICPECGTPVPPPMVK